MRTGTKTVIVYDVELEVEYETSEYVPEVNTLSNGDPGYPAEGGELYITSVRVNDVDIFDLISDHVMNMIENECLKD